jgi:hypothetical protein
MYLQSKCSTQPTENQPALLTAGIPALSVHLKLDWITFVGRINPRFKRTINEEIHIPRFEQWGDIVERSSAKFPYRYNYQTVSKCVIQQAEKLAPVPEWRISGNPSNPEVLATIEHMATMMIDKRVTRLDWAVDYNLDLSSYIMTTMTPRKTNSHNSQNGKLETHYLGTRNSPDQYRIYDKALESGLSETLWRIEQQLTYKPKDTWQLSLPFHDLYLTKPTPDLPTIDRLVLDGLQRNPQEWGNLTRKYKAKYRNLIKSRTLADLNPQPFDVYCSLGQPFTDWITSTLEDSK